MFKLSVCLYCGLDLFFKTLESHNVELWIIKFKDLESEIRAIIARSVLDLGLRSLSEGLANRVLIKS